MIKVETGVGTALNICNILDYLSLCVTFTVRSVEHVSTECDHHQVLSYVFLCHISYHYFLTSREAENCSPVES